MKYSVKDEKGFSLVEAIVGAALLGGAALVVMGGSKFSMFSQKSAERMQNSQDFTSTSLSGVKQALFNTRGDGGKKTEGLCQLISVDPDSEPPVAPVQVSFRDFNSTFPSSYLEEFLPEWEVGNSSECKRNVGRYSYCFKKRGESGKDAPVLSIGITPVNMNPVGGAVFSPLKGSDLSGFLDVKTVGFEFKSIAFSTNNNGNRVPLENKSFEWLGLIGNCHLPYKGEEYTVSMTGLEAIDPAEKVVFNRGGFVTNQEKPIDVTFKKIVAQEGKYNASGGFVHVDKSKNIITSCQELNYRCPQVNSGQREYDDIRFNADLDYIYPNYLTKGSSAQVTMSYDIKKNSSSITSRSKKSWAFDPSERLEYNRVGSTLKERIFASHFIGLEIEQKSSNSICRQICSKSSNYNTSGSTPSSRYTGELTVKFDEFDGKEEKIELSESVGCTACYMKNCDNWGVGTFGPMDQMPAQPKDAVIPECSLLESTSVRHTALPFKDSRKVSSPWNGSSTCIAARVSSSGNSLELFNENCGAQLPVMCFAYGTFMLARDISGRSSNLSTKSYREASYRCAQIGREIVNSSDLNGWLKNSHSLPSSGSNYDFLNLANQGIFLAPQLPSDFELYKNWRANQGISSSTKFWIALNKDSKKNVSSRVPVISSSLKSQKHAVYHDGNGNLIYKKLNQQPSFSSGNHGILFHNIKYKGVIRSSDEAGRSRFPFICRKKSAPHEIFLSSDRSRKFEKGKEICEDENGRFVPPFTPLEWLTAMSKVEPLSPNHPFPNPNSLSLGSMKGAWVAVTDLNDSGSQWKVADIDNELEDFLSEEDYTPKSTDDYLLLDKKGKIHNIRATIVSRKINETGSITVNNSNRVFNISIGGLSYEVVLKDKYEEEEDDDGNTVKKGLPKNLNMSLSDIIIKMNSAMSGNGTINVISKNGDKFLELTTTRSGYVANDRIQLESNNITKSLLRFKDFVDKVPNAKEVCLSGNSLSKVSKGSNCSYKLKEENIRDSQMMRGYWLLNGFNNSSTDYFLFKKGF